MKAKKMIALSLISAMVLSGFGQTPFHGTSIRAAVNETPYAVASSEIPAPVATSTPEATPEVSPTPEITMQVTSTSYPTAVPANLLCFNPEIYYDANESEGITVVGMFEGLQELYYNGQKLVRGTDYKSEEFYMTFSNEFLKSLPVGDNEFIAYGYREGPGDDVEEDFKIIKLDNRLTATYTPEYPLSSTKAFHSSMYYVDETIYYGLDEVKNIDHVFIDHKEIEKCKTTYDGYAVIPSDIFPGGILRVQDRLLAPINAGVHFIEVVADGESEVLKSVTNNTFNSIEKVMNEASKSDTQEEISGSFPPSDATPTPTPTPTSTVPMYDTFFHMNGNAIYDTAVSNSVYFSGSLYGLNSIYYGEKRLEPGKDYNRDSGLLKFSDEFLQELPYGDNQLTVYANYNPSASNSPSSAYITKVDKPIARTYDAKYPLAETSNFISKLVFCTNNSVPMIYGMKEAKQYDEVYVDHQLVPQTDPENSYRKYYHIYDGDVDPFFQLENSFFKDLPIGLHFIELVSNGESEVIYLIKSEGKDNALKLLEDASKPVTDMKLNLDVTTDLKDNFTQRFLVQKTDDMSQFMLDKLKIRYYFSKEDNKEQSFTCDNAGIHLGVSPYYINCTDMVTGTFKDNYVEIGFDESYNLENDSLQFAVRYHHTDWSPYADMQKGYVEAYYDGNLVYTDK